MRNDTVVPKALRKRRAPQLIAIVGGSGAGKTWLADQLQKEMGKEVARLSLDDFYRDRSHLSPKRRAAVNFDHPRAVDWRSLERTLRDCLAGRPTRLPRYDFATHSRRRETSLFKPKPFVVIDGLWLLRRPSLRRLFRWSIFVDCPSRLRFRRRLRRDATERGRHPASVRSQFRGTVAPMHKRFVAPQRRWANIVLKDKWGMQEIAGLVKALHGFKPDVI